ncbi:hypothetical protein VII00023_11791 [Vibrio ichthyoenteri ATCC 700023]|uniref:Uncharacterized protein n=1 Tax=Vibrio ichthyoenteri ATCC 700023 TaxID=870968 RepID=F9S4Y5_9VIBR|nr:hypothetical protein [Vibrio ichthyoenteri]EGU36340.1 hypothetical protein VII00023_11791 [Vibrio ichthyoenteri ATCC 700023]
MLRVRGFFSAACLVLLLANATEEQLLPRDPQFIAEAFQLQLPSEHQISRQLTTPNHKNRHYYLIARYLNKPADRHNQLSYGLPSTDTLSTLVARTLSQAIDESIGITGYRVKQHYESNLIYRFIHSRNDVQIG